MGLAISLALAATGASASIVTFSFVFDAPDFSKPELDPLEQIFVTNGITSVTGTLSYDTADASFVTSNFTFSSNIDAFFDSGPDELAFSNTGTLNQIRSWDIEIGGTDYILELTGLDPADTLSNRWFGGRVLLFPEISTFELTAAGGGLSRVPLPAGLPLLLSSLGAVAVLRRACKG
jgi:hypothetical protein